MTSSLYAKPYKYLCFQFYYYFYCQHLLTILVYGSGNLITDTIRAILIKLFNQLKIEKQKQCGIISSLIGCILYSISL